jgi:CrcB protein
MKWFLMVGMGSFAGGVLRYWITQWLHARYPGSFPIGTWMVNMLGCFLIGLFFAYTERSYVNQEVRLFMTTGLLGGFTTFSAFSNESIGLFRSGNITSAMLYVVASLLVGLLATWLGYTLLRPVV